MHMILAVMMALPRHGVMLQPAIASQEPRCAIRVTCDLAFELGELYIVGVLTSWRPVTADIGGTAMSNALPSDLAQKSVII